jgi:hypothetical protein
MGYIVSKDSFPICQNVNIHMMNVAIQYRNNHGILEYMYGVYHIDCKCLKCEETHECFK